MPVPVAVGKGDHGNLQAIYLVEGVPYGVWQRQDDGSWHWRDHILGGAAVRVPLPHGTTQLTALATGVGHHDDLQVVALDTVGGLRLMSQDSSSGRWQWHENPLPSGTGAFVAFATGLGNDRNLQVVALHQDGILFLVYQYRSDGSWHNRPGPLPQAPDVRLTSVVTGTGNDGNLQVIGLSTDGVPHLLYQHHKDGSWHWRPDPLPHDPTVRLSTLATGTGNDGNLQVIALSTDGIPHLLYQHHKDGSWHWRPDPLPHDPTVRLSTLATGTGNDGNLQVIALSTDGIPHLLYQHHKDGSWYRRPEPLPHDPHVRYTAVAAGRGYENDLEVVLLGDDGVPYLIYQLVRDGSWWQGRPLVRQAWADRPTDAGAAFAAMGKDHRDEGHYTSCLTPYYDYAEVTYDHIQGMARYGPYYLFIRDDTGGSSGKLIVSNGVTGDFTAYDTPSGFDHPGGCQIIGDYLAVALENTDDSSHKGAAVCFYYLGELSRSKGPQLLDKRIVLADHDRKLTGAGCVGITDIGTGSRKQYLVAVDDGGKVAFFLSTPWPLYDPSCTFTLLGTAELTSGKVPWKGADNLCLVTDGRATKLIAFTSDGDAVDLPKGDYAVSYAFDMVGTTPRLVQEDPLHMYTNDQGNGAANWIHFRWGAGLRVVPPNSLRFYCSDRNPNKKRSGWDTLGRLGINIFG